MPAFGRLLVLILVPAAARADVTTPPPAVAAAPPALASRVCANAEWLAIKHAVRRFCTNGRGRATRDCESIRNDLRESFRDDPARCTIGERGGAGRVEITVQPDCWHWDVTALRQGRGFQILEAEWNGNNCD